ncbi:hypothetical protein GKC30_14690 [Pseudodesulfovibrio sp. F-1]|uniref:Transposase IS4-like domain-containing protein n=1 Tax=Pseudodesulfovibrio alkaliphilus TaxID=2661613 RepID=A0A7K1KS43_9BACT|nr:hypothetical protein [Pseudodesulfovibrio alkaliphilus]MUM78878.1 hypothetical protein [Pseudodesulfovibrio alkaliphilus]
MSLASYIWRWEIEVNFRDEKTLLGLGEAQVRTSRSVETLTPFLAAVYALLLLAIEKVGGRRRTLPPPAWLHQRLDGQPRTSTAQALREFRTEVWGDALMGRNKSSFMNTSTSFMKPIHLENCAASAVCYATR